MTIQGIMTRKITIVLDRLRSAHNVGNIFRIAEALDRSRAGLVTGINCDVLGDSVIMKTEVTGDASLELREAEGVNNEFKKAFRKNLEIL